MANRDIEARLKISAIDRTSGVLSRVAQRLGMVSNKADQVSRRTVAMGSAAKSGGVMVGRVLVPALAAMGGAKVIKDAAEVERQMNRIGITAGASAEKTKDAGDAVREMTKGVALPFQDGVEALDTLVASGMDLEEAMAFLPAILATAQATGASTVDIANTANKSSSALKISADEMSRAFDLMSAYGKAGQFELKDMAQYIPSLANSFAVLGYEGEDGLARLLSVLQTLRESTGDASAAATQAGNIFGKIYSEETANKFEKMGVNLRKEMEKAVAAGVDPLEAFIKLSNTAIGGDMTKLPLLFSDQQFREGMISLMTKQDSYQGYLDIAGSDDVTGTVDRDLQRVLDDSQASIDRMSNEWEKFLNNVGNVLTGPVTEGLDAVNSQLDFRAAQRKYFQSQGLTEEAYSAAMEASKVPLLGDFPRRAAVIAMQGGYEGEYRGHDISDWAIMPPDSEFRAGDLEGVPPELLPTPVDHRQQLLERAGRLSDRRVDKALHMPDSYFEMPDLNAPKEDASLIDRLMDLFDNEVGTGPAASTRLKSREDALSQDVEDGSRTVGQAFNDGADEVRKAGGDAGNKVRDSGDDVARALGNAAAAIDSAARQLTAGELRKRSRNRASNSNPGKSMKPENNAPEGAY